MATGLCPDPLGELNRSPDPVAAIRGPTSKGRKREGRGTLLQGVRGKTPLSERKKIYKSSQTVKLLLGPLSD